MAATRPGPAKETTSAEPSAEPGSSEPTVSSGPGFKGWLPLAANVTIMPLVAYFTTTLLLAPKLKSAGTSQPAAGHEEHAEAPGRSQTGPTTGKGKFSAPLGNKVLVNVAGTLGTRYLLANLTLVSSQPGLKELVEKNDAELRDVAASVLASKTIADLEKPGARNLIRTELISVFNNVLGGDIVSELFLTEFAIQ